MKLMPPHYVEPFVKRGKNSAADVAATCEAVSRDARFHSDRHGVSFSKASVADLEKAYAAKQPRISR